MAYKQEPPPEYFEQFIRPIGDMWAIYANYWTSNGHKAIKAEHLLWLSKCNGSKTEAEKQLAKLKGK